MLVINADTYQYNQKDHLGNTMMAFSKAAGPLSSTNKPALEQLTDYYLFGNSFEKNSVSKNRYLYKGKELQDQVIGGMAFGWYDYGARFYDTELGRWHTMDPLAEKYRRWSPYNYCVDNPLRFIDPDGMRIANPNDRGAQYIIQSLKQTKTGLLYLNKIEKVRYPVTLNYAEGVGDGSNNGTCQSVAKNGKITSANITIYEGMVEYKVEQVAAAQEIVNNGGAIASASNTDRERISGGVLTKENFTADVAIHEIIHGTDKSANVNFESNKEVREGIAEKGELENIKERELQNLKPIPLIPDPLKPMNQL